MPEIKLLARFLAFQHSQCRHYYVRNSLTNVKSFFASITMKGLRFLGPSCMIIVREAGSARFHTAALATNDECRGIKYGIDQLRSSSV